MAKYDRRISERIGKVMSAFRHGELESDGSGHPVKSRRQAMAIGLSAAREKPVAPAVRRKSRSGW